MLSIRIGNFLKSKLEYSLWGFYIIVLLLYFLHLYRMRGLGIDDACMYIRYANNIINGFGYTWNPGDPPVYGCTSIPFTFIMVILRFIFPLFNSYYVLVFVSAFFSLCSVAGLVYLFRITLEKVSSLIILGVIILLSFQHLFTNQAITGIDTSFSFFINTLSMILLYKTISHKGHKYILIASIAAYLSFLTRPDGGLVAFLMPAFLFLYFKLDVKRLIHFYLLLGCLVCIDVFAKYYYFKDILPLPFYVKRIGYYKGYLDAHYWNPFYYLQEMVEYLFLFLVTIIYFVNRKSLKALLLLIPILVSIILSFGFTQIMGNDARFYFPLVPIILFVFVIIFKESNKGNLKIEWKPVRLVFAFCIPFVLLFALAKAADIWASKVEAREIKEAFIINTDPQYKQMGWNHLLGSINSLCKKLPPNTLITASEHGYIAADNPSIKILDLVGLHDAFIAKNGYTDQYLMSKKPQLIWMSHTAYTQLYHDITTGEGFVKNYYFIPGAYNYGIAVLKSEKKIQDILMGELKAKYPEAKIQLK